MPDVGLPRVRAQLQALSWSPIRAGGPRRNPLKARGRPRHARVLQPRRRVVAYAPIADQVKPMFRTKCPALRLRRPPPAQWTMAASRMMARTTMTTQKKNQTMPGIAHPPIALPAMAANYPNRKDIFMSQPHNSYPEASR